MTINEVLNQLTAEAFEEIKEEFEELLQKAKTDRVAYVQTTAERTQQALVALAEGKLSQADVNTLLNKELRIAQIEANAATIEAKRRIQDLAMRILVIGLSLASGFVSKK